MDKSTIKKLNRFDNNVKNLNIITECIRGQIDLERFEYLEELYCSNNKITGITWSPESLKKIYCQNNGILELNNLPPRLTELFCSNNLLSKLPNLPTTLIKLDCSYNFINRLDELPCSIKLLNCSYNVISNLDNLPCLLEYLDCSYNYINSLDNLPSSITGLVDKPRRTDKLVLKTEEELENHIGNLLIANYENPNPNQLPHPNTLPHIRPHRINSSIFNNIVRWKKL